MKKEGSLKLILSLLIIVLIIIISLGGIYCKDKNVMKNILREYKLGMDLDNITIIKLETTKPEEDSSEENTTEENETEESKTEGTSSEEGKKEENTTEENKTDETEPEIEVSEEKETTEEKQDNKTESEQQNQEQSLYTVDNYKKTKKIIENRLNKSDVHQYTLRLDESTGVIVMEVPTDVNSGILQNTFVIGKTEIKIQETGEVIGDHTSFEKIETGIDSSLEMYNMGSFIKLDLYFTKDATNKFIELKNNVAAETEAEEETIVISIDGTSICSMEKVEFLENVATGTLPLKFGDYLKDKNELNESLAEANSMKNVIESGPLPLTYSASYINTIETNANKYGIISIFAIVFVVMSVYLLIRYKLKGILSAINILGFLSAILLIVRYANVRISIASIVAIVAIMIVQFLYLIKLLSNKKIDKRVFNSKTLEFTKMLIPAFLISTIIAFANILEISGFGMILFWGLILFEIFNNIFTRAILTNVKNK